jgi:hypothetical protein
MGQNSAGSLPYKVGHVVAGGLRCAFLETGQVIVSSNLDGIRLEASEHAKLETAVAPRVREVSGEGPGSRAHPAGRATERSVYPGLSVRTTRNSALRTMRQGARCANRQKALTQGSVCGTIGAHKSGHTLITARTYGHR